MKKNLLTVLVLALTLVNTILIGVMMVSVMGTNKKTAKLVGDIATVLNLELGTAGEEEKPEVSLADTEVYAIDGSMTILLKSEPGATKSTYIVFDIALSLNKKHADYKKYGGENFKSYDSMIKSAINDAVMQYTELECRNDMQAMKDDILKAIQEIFQSDFVYNISLSGVKFG
ncbi:MAG: flagellar basal body-associated FliL family protein [Acetatifactor sp.]